MQKLSSRCVLIGLSLYLCCVEDSVTECRNEAGYCRSTHFYFYSLSCYFTNNDTQSIKVLFRDCTNDSSLYSLNIYKDYFSTTYGNLIIDLELPQHITEVVIYNYKDDDLIRLTTSVQNSGLLIAYFYSLIALGSNDFFNYFTHLQLLVFHPLFSLQTLSFINLQSLTYLSATFVGPITHTFSNNTLQGVSNLNYLRLENCYVSDGAFSGLSKLEFLFLFDIEAEGISNNFFEGLPGLIHLELFNTLGFPIETLLHARSLRSLGLTSNGFQTIDPFIFQQMNSLNSIYTPDRFVCDCRLQWTSLVAQYGISISGGYCSEPFNFISITDEQLYTNCVQTESYQCFNKSITCANNLFCHNTEDSYFCGCPIGNSLYSSGQCRDIDECSEMATCQHLCYNTQGSYYCVCEEGYKLASNGHDCDDVDECEELNGGCEFGCINSNGSHQCYGCESCPQSNQTNKEGLFVCELRRNGYNLTISNFFCPSVNQSTALTPQPNISCVDNETSVRDESGCNVPTLVILALSIFLNVVFLVLLVIALLVYLLRKTKKVKFVPKTKDSPSNTVETIPNNIASVSPPAIPNNEESYNPIPIFAKPDISKDSQPDSQPVQNSNSTVSLHCPDTIQTDPEGYTAMI